MSFYNMINGVKPQTFFLIPMLGEKHPDDYPRFRDCFMGPAEGEPTFDEDIILVYTRVGGGNRGCGYGEDELCAHPNFITTYDDDFDSTYGNYVFSVPDEFRDDYKKVGDGDFKSISPALQERCRKVFPKLSGFFDELWGGSEAVEA